jgi:hypothetical protein
MVGITWWERNQTAKEPAVRVSSDNGQTFGPILKLDLIVLLVENEKRSSN